MSTNLTCFVFGIPLTIIWAVMLRRGIALGRNLRKIHRDEDPFSFWILTGFQGLIALGFLITPVLSWAGLR